MSVERRTVTGCELAVIVVEPAGGPPVSQGERGGALDVGLAPDRRPPPRSPGFARDRAWCGTRGVGAGRGISVGLAPDLLGWVPIRWAFEGSKWSGEGDLNLRPLPPEGKGQINSSD